MRVLVGHSEDPLAPAAAAEAAEAVLAQASGTPIVGLLLYVSPSLDVQAAVAAIRAAFPHVPLIGCTTDGECSSTHRFCEDSLVLTGFASDAITGHAAVGRGLSTDVRAAAREVWTSLTARGEPALVVVVAESLGADGVALTEALAELVPAHIPVVGGAAGDQWKFESTRQVFGDELLQDGVAALALYGPLAVGVGIGSGWEPIGPTATVTRAAGGTVSEIDGQSALSWFREYLGARGAPSPEYPFAVYPEGGGYYLRAPLVFNESDGTIGFAASVPTGSRVRVTAATRDAVLTGATQAVRHAIEAFGPRKPSGMLVFSCAARKQVLGTRTREELDALDAATGDVPIAGFYTYGEIGPPRPGTHPQYHNETVVAVLLGE